MTANPRKWHVAAYGYDDRIIKMADLNSAEQSFDGLDEARFECHRLLQRFCDVGGPEPVVAYCKILIAVGRAERKTYQVVGTHITPLDGDGQGGEDVEDDDTEPGKEGMN